MSDLEIHTLNARESMLLSFVYGLSGGSTRRVNQVIVDATKTLAFALAEVGIDYSKLGPALTPRRNRSELALLFEIEAIGSSSYGYEVHNRVLELLGKKEAHSVLAGDLKGDQRRLAYMLRLHMTAARQYEMADVGTQLFCVYLTNCAPTALRRFVDELRQYPPFIGACDLTYSSEFRTYVSLCVSPRYVQHGSFTIQSKGDEEPLLSAQNPAGYEFARLGFSTVSVQATYFDLLLGYKIERPPAPFDEPDQFFALNAISASPVELRDCTFTIDDAKFKYLTDAKGGTLTQLGLRDCSKSRLESAIRAKIDATYLYRLRFVEEHRFAGFSVLLELDAPDSDQPVRIGAGLGFDEAKRALRLITLF